MVVDQKNTSDNDLPLYAIYGPGRSGTTWLGSIINSHPDIAYRFEPLRKNLRVPRVKKIWQTSQTDKISNKELKRLLYNSLLPAHSLLDKPPFFKKTNTKLLGHKLAWSLARKIPSANAVCEQLYTPTGSPPLVFKEVHWQIIERFIQPLHLRSVFILRSPHGTIASRLRGQRAGLMPTGQCKHLEQVIENHRPSLADELPQPVSTYNDVQKNAVLWRLEAERMVDYIQEHPEHILVFYEDLCTRPFEIAREIFQHFDIPWHQQTEDFIMQSTSSKDSLRNREIGINAYFSVSRNTTEVVNRWSQELTATEKEQIDEIIYPSKAYQFALQQGMWS